MGVSRSWVGPRERERGEEASSCIKRSGSDSGRMGLVNPVRLPQQLLGVYCTSLNSSLPFALISAATVVKCLAISTPSGTSASSGYMG